MKKKAVLVTVVLLIVAAAAAFKLLYHNPDPTLRDWQRHTTTLVIEIGEDVGRPRDRHLEIADRMEIDGVLDMIVLEPWFGPGMLPCDCSGNPHLNLYEGGQLLATISVHHGHCVHCTLARGNIAIRETNVPAVMRYFADLGIQEYQERVPKSAFGRRHAY